MAQSYTLYPAMAKLSDRLSALRVGVRDSKLRPHSWSGIFQRLLAKRSAGSGQVSSSGSDTALYSQVNKSDHQETSSSPYLLAEDLDSNLDNHAVSYDSEDTVDEDSDSDEASPNLPPKQLPVVQTPRSPLTDRHGYLYKQGGKQNNKGWRKRYVTFDGTRLRYFSGAKSRISKRIIPVEVMKDIESDVKDSHTGKFKFRVVTINRNRNYLFAAETLEDHDYWTQILMKAIIEYKQETGRGSIGQGMMLGGSIMHTPEKQGYVRLDDNKIYMAIKEGRMCYYKNEVDFNFATAIHEVKLCIASVKDLGKNRLQFATPYHTYSITFESDGESEEWKLAIEEGIATSLSDDKVLTQVYQNPSNRLCADCSCPRPQWAVLHLVTMVCSSCAGLHRQFWPFKVKSLRMDVKVWTKPLISLYVNAGNGVMNSVWEGALTNPSDKIKCSAILSRRQSYMVEKYLLKAFFLPAIDIVPDKPSSLQLRQGLEKSIKEGRLKQVVFLVNKGADPSPGVLAVSSVQLAESANQSDIAQYLKVNGAENETLKDIWAVIRSKHSDKNTENVVIKSGYLYRMGKKDYPRQWIVLKPSFLKCYDEETSEEPKHTIPLCSIVNLSRHENEKNEPSLEFTCQDGNTCTYIFGADERSTIDAWITKIHSEMLIDTEKQDLCLEFAKAGHANCKRGHLGVWKLCWLLVRKRQMYMHYTDGTSKEEVDLRKIHNLTIETPKEASANPASEKGPVISLFSSDRSLSGSDQRDIIYYIQSDLKQETERWFKVIDDASKEVSSSLEDQQLNRDNVPILIEKCVDFVSIHGMKTEGIYRLAGTHSKITNLLNDLIKGARGVDIKMEEYTVLDAADTLKRYLRHLQDPIMSSALYGKWLSASMISLPSIDSHRFQEVHEEKLYTYKNLLSELPDVNFASLKMIIGHLHRVASYEAENKMGRVNLATVFGPVLLSGSLVEKPTQATFQCTNYEIKLVDDLISYYQWLFSIDDEELKKETQVQRYIQLIKEAEHQPPRAKDFIFSIYVNNKMCDPISMEVPAVMTAEQVVEKVAQSKRIPRIDGYSLFHIVCGGDLERSLAASEKVLDVNLVTWNWSDEHRKDSYLCVKEDQYRDYMDQVSGQDIGRFTELQFSDRKGWKKMYFELNESLLICYKDKSKTKHYEWDLSLLSIYIGVEKKRKPPTIFGLTFLTQEDSGTKQTHLGRSVCFPTSSEMYIWLSAMYSQSEDKLSSPAPSFSGLSYSESKGQIAQMRKNPISKSRVGSILKNPFKGSKS
ncbi:arf-GAP with Rho-GAP domain, ANK repeat and PH domain-containing protein 1-like isoform X2 [Watersipora subatra]|uniref:arf-GAP with Rho-GAP domain, ANK repeat and PH domain-containing protein 1-like isoform X2 n=1 Tax=Watersipora subatra TaxID=2589382 RepID=UPI00355B03BF